MTNAAYDILFEQVYCSKCGDYIYHENLLESISSSEKALISTYSEKPVVCGGLRGLRNLGSTCYLNVILQSLIRNPYLSKFFLSDNHFPALCMGKKPCLACEIDSLVSGAFCGSTAPYAPSSFLRALWDISSGIATSGQHDAHECFINLINALHNSLTQMNEPCDCIVHTTFGGNLQSRFECPCGHMHVVNDPILDISLDISAFSGHIHLSDCLNRFTNMEVIKYTCPSCRRQTEANRYLKICTLPKVLGIQLKVIKTNERDSKYQHQ